MDIHLSSSTFLAFLGAPPASFLAAGSFCATKTPAPPGPDTASTLGTPNPSGIASARHSLAPQEAMRVMSETPGVAGGRHIRVDI